MIMLYKSKEFAINNEDYQEAKKLKAKILELKNVIVSVI